MNNNLRTIHCVLEANVNLDLTIDDSKGMKVFQLIKYVTGKNKNRSIDYTISNTDNWNGHETVLLEGSKGFIRMVVTPLK